MIDIQNGGLKLFKNPKQLGAKNFFFLFRHFEGFPRREKSKARTHPKAFPRSPLSLSTIEREKGRKIKTYRC